MGKFGDRISTLLDTYTKCLNLLKDFTKPTSKQSSSDPDAAELSSSIREARSRVARSYSSKAGRKGKSFEKGDATSRTSLKRVIAKLTSTLSDLGLRLSRNRRDALDYRSLTALSRASQLEALQTMTDLSRRLGSRSSLTVSEPRYVSYSRRSKSRGSTESTISRASSKPSKNDRISGRQRSRSKRLSRQETRYSSLTMSSNSTKIGEVRQRDRHHHQVNMVAYPQERDLDRTMPVRHKKKR